MRTSASGQIRRTAHTAGQAGLRRSTMPVRRIMHSKTLGKQISRTRRSCMRRRKTVAVKAADMARLTMRTGPVDWGYDDDGYVFYTDGGYSMYDRRHPGLRLSINVL